MSRRIEIQPAANGMAILETWVGWRRTGMSETMAVVAARLRAEKSGAIVVDHTTALPSPMQNGEVTFR